MIENIDEEIDLDELEEKLQNRLDEEVSELKFLVEEKKKIGSVDNLGEIIKETVWEQFLNQIAIVAGEDFIKENRNLTLDLSNEAHIQTTENFVKGNIAIHNSYIDYKERYDDWNENFQKDLNGNIITHTTRTGKEENTLVRGARNIFDKNRPTGLSSDNIDMDHTISAGEIIRDPKANAHMSKKEQVEFANSEVNLNKMNASLNRSKGDKSVSDWLDNPNSNGQKPKEIFNISSDDESKLREKDFKAREEYKKIKDSAEEKSMILGKKSQKEEAFKVTGKALRAVFMQLLAELIKEIIAKLVKWFKSIKKSLSTLLESLKEAIHSFIGKLKTHLINAGNAIISTIATAIIGPIFATIKKVWMILQKGWNSLKEAIEYIRNPENKNKPIGILFMEVGKIIIAGLTGIGALVLGDVIEKGLMTIPIFAIQIPLIGSLANVLGIFFGAIIAGIIGAIAINFIQVQVEKCLKMENVDLQIIKGNEILNLQSQVQAVSEVRFGYHKNKVAQEVYDRHMIAAMEMKTAIDNIGDNCQANDNINENLADIDSMLNSLKDE